MRCGDLSKHYHVTGTAPCGAVLRGDVLAGSEVAPGSIKEDYLGT